MKFAIQQFRRKWMRSHPSRVRGLKSKQIKSPYQHLDVAPFAGAWIEITETGYQKTYISKVAPFAGAWIEIGIAMQFLFYDLVAPFAGAWIEIMEMEWSDIHLASHPSRVRGLKSLIVVTPMMIGGSHPSRVRGLKSEWNTGDHKRCQVAPFAGAWIEITRQSRPLQS